jgi:hypothetical protein
MKKLFLFISFFVLFSAFASASYAETVEGQIKAYRTVNGVQIAVSVSVKLLAYQNDRYQVYVLNGNRFEGSTSDTFSGGYNGVYSVTTITTPSDPGVFPEEIPYSVMAGKVCLVIGGAYISWAGNFDADFIYNDDNKTIYMYNKLTWTGRTSDSTCVDYTVSVRNSFNGGQIQFFSNSAETVPSGGYLTKTFNSLEFPVTVTALPNQTAAEYSLWNSWSVGGSALLKELSAGNSTLTANFDPAEKLIVQGTSASIGSTTVAENGTIKEKTGTQLLISINSKTTNYILYSLDSLYKNNVYHTSSSLFYYTPQSQATTTFNAVMKVSKPVNSYRIQHYGTTVGDPIVVYWTAHPSSLVVGYEVWRTIKNVQSATRIATISDRTVTSYTDNECLYTDSYTNDLIYYDVRAKLSNDVTSDADFVAVYGDYNGSKVSDPNILAKQLNTAPTEYSLGNYPNPFNPTTVIRYAMPEAGQVSLKIYNVLSQEVANLVESNQSAGVHQINFNASHLPTGIYIARLQAGARVMTSKLQLIK